MTVKVDRLEWWCDICLYGTAFEESDAGLVQIHAQMHIDHSHPGTTETERTP
jgi:hypothetical protein